MKANFNTISSLIIIGITLITLFLSNLLFPKIKLGKRIILSSFWIIALLGTLLLIAFQDVSLENFWNVISSNTAVNPLKVIALFFSMALLSIFLDEIGFFSFLAAKFASRFNKNQFILFIALYLLISVLTVFTSNDIIILTFTPFICYFAKRCKINPLPYLIMEFIAANTMSMCLIIGNPTNIYLATSFGIDFVKYLQNIILPTVAASLTSFLIMFGLFFKKLKEPISPNNDEIKTPNKFLMIVGLVILISTTIMLAISSYIGIEMYFASLIGAAVELIFLIAYSIAKKENVAFNTLKHIPYNLLPFIISMFVVTLSLNEIGFTDAFADLLNKGNQVFTYGYSGLLTANLINNIPMSLLYANVLEGASTQAIYASIAASNIAAYLTPMGALAGIMFVSLCKKGEANVSFITFVKYGAITAICALSVALIMINLLPMIE